MHRSFYAEIRKLFDTRRKIRNAIKDRRNGNSIFWKRRSSIDKINNKNQSQFSNKKSWEQTPSYDESPISFHPIPRIRFWRKQTVQSTIRIKLSTFNPFLGAEPSPGFTFSRATSALIWKDRSRRKRGGGEGRGAKKGVSRPWLGLNPPLARPRIPEHNASRRPGTFPGFFNRYCDESRDVTGVAVTPTRRRRTRAAPLG